MKTYQIPHSDLEVSRLAYGSWHLGGTWDKTALDSELKRRAAELLHTALEQGINHIDLADIYTLGKSDEAIGHVLKENPGLREQLVLQEKAGIVLGFDEDFGPPSRYDFSFEHLTQSVERSLKRLHTDYVDILALHRPDPLVDYEEVARALDHLQEQGMVRYFGVSNHSAAQIKLLQKYCRQPIVVNQLELNLLHHHLIADGILVNQVTENYSHNDGVLEHCRLENIMVQAWSPVAGGQLFAPAADAPINIRNSAAVIRDMASAKGTTPEAIAFAWLLRHPMGIQPIIGSLKSNRIVDSAQADGVEMSRREWYSLLEAARGAGVP